MDLSRYPTMSSAWAPRLGFLKSNSNILPRLCGAKPCPTTKTILSLNTTFFVDVCLLRPQRTFSQVYVHQYSIVYFIFYMFQMVLNFAIMQCVGNKITDRLIDLRRITYAVYD